MPRIVLLVLAAIFVVAIAQAVVGSLAWLALAAVIVLVVALVLGVRRRTGTARRYSARRHD